MEIIFLFLIIAAYFIPSIIAKHRRHGNTAAIFVTNLLLGWSGLAWVIALIWACTDNVKAKGGAV